MPSPLISSLLDTLRQGDLSSVSRLMPPRTLQALSAQERGELERSLVQFGESALDGDHDLARAIASLQLATQLDPESSRPWALLGHAWQRTAEESGEPSDLRTALTCFREAQRRGPLETPQVASLGEALRHVGIETGDTTLIGEAREVYLKALQEGTAFDGIQGQLWLGLARSSILLFEISRQKPYRKESLHAFEEASKRDPFSPSLYLEWANAVLMGAGERADRTRLDQVIGLGQRAVNLAPESPIARCQLARLLTVRACGLEDPTDFVRAQEQLDWLVQRHPHHPLTHQAAGTVAMARARYFEEISQLEEAARCFRRAAELDPSLLSPWSSLNSALFLLSGLLEHEQTAAEAVHAAGHAHRLRPWACRERLDLALSLLRLGEISMTAGPLEQAISLLEGLLEERGPQHPDALEWFYHLGCAYDFLGDASGQDRCYEKAIEMLQKVVEADPARHYARMNLAQAHLHLGEVNDDVDHLLRAIEQFAELSNIDRDSPLVWEEWAVALLTLSQLMQDPANLEMSELLLREAEEKLMTAALLGSGAAWFTLGCLYALAERPEQALRALRRAQELGELPPVRDLSEHPWLASLHELPEFQLLLTQLSDN
jgi:tetratricopeptide (TPR) repeat protein